MNVKHGNLIISLDFELFWGVFDVRTLDSYKQNLKAVHSIVPRLLELSEAYGIKLTFATVGFLFAKDKDQIIEFSPKQKPAYKNQRFSPYSLLDDIGQDEVEDPYHYAHSLLEIIKSNNTHEIGSHTFCHYYSNETGQTAEQFEDDLQSSINIAKQSGISVRSFVFPRNQINKEYLSICAKHGILSFRGTEKHWMYDTSDTEKLGDPKHRIMRLLDAYINISGHNTHRLEKQNGIFNIAASRFLRPYSKKLWFLEKLKINRIKKSMTHAAKHKEIFHLWWHPHNFAENTEENFRALEDLFKHYKFLNETYGFQSDTMSGIVKR